MIRLIALGVVGLAAALAGILMANYLLVAVGGILIIAGFFWFVRSDQGTAAPARTDSSVPDR